jgi:hypothetical protein
VHVKFRGSYQTVRHACRGSACGAYQAVLSVYVQFTAGLRSAASLDTSGALCAERFARRSSRVVFAAIVSLSETSGKLCIPTAASVCQHTDHRHQQLCMSCCCHTKDPYRAGNTHTLSLRCHSTHLVSARLSSSVSATLSDLHLHRSSRTGKQSSCSQQVQHVCQSSSQGTGARNLHS